MKYILTLLLVLIATGMTYVFTPRPYQVHYHANFGVYIDGARWDFSSPDYMEEVARCSITTGATPEDRIHLHENNGGLVHVHMAASTWGDLFSNLYWGIGSQYIATDHNSFYTPNATKHLYYILNGSLIINPANIAVKSEDRLLVWYGTGTSDDILKKWETLVDRNAGEYNKKADPAGCGGNGISGLPETLRSWIESIFGHEHL